MAYKGIGGGKSGGTSRGGGKSGGGGQGFGKSGGRGKSAQGPRQPAGRKEGSAGAKRAFDGDRFRPAQPKEYKGPASRNTGPSSSNTGTVSRNTGTLSRNTGTVSRSSGSSSAKTGPASRSTGPAREQRPDRPRYQARPSAGRSHALNPPNPPLTKGGQGGFAAPVGEAVYAASEDKVMGINPVMELLKSGGRPVDALFIDKDKGGKHFDEMITLAKQSGVKLKVVPREALDKLSMGLHHQGVLATVAAKEYADFYELSRRALKKGGLPLMLILDGIEDPQNLGSIIRTAESAGVDGVVIPEHRAAHLTAAVSRASSGALEHMPVAKVTNLVDAITYLKDNGFWVVGLEGGSAKDYTGFDMKVPLAVVMGSEGKGIRPVVKKVCDQVVSLPMLGKVNSLNVSVAAGVILYEVLRQRGAKN